MDSIFVHLTKIGVDRPNNTYCMDQAANHQATYMMNNYYLGHSQSVDGIGDTIIPCHRVYAFCDTSYISEGEICVKSLFKDTADMIKNIGHEMLDQWLGSPSHKKCLEQYHEFYGISIQFEYSEQYKTIIAWGTIVYGKKLNLYNPRFPKHYSINVEAEAKFRSKFNDYMIIR